MRQYFSIFSKNNSKKGAALNICVHRMSLSVWILYGSKSSHCLLLCGLFVYGLVLLCILCGL